MLVDFETRILAQIDDRVEHGSDDELFAGGYLRGHLTLAVAELEEEGESSAEALYLRVEESIQKAIKAGELAPPDQILVLDTWKKLLDNVRNLA
nr:YfcL family protein [uncultured Moellerella sp.]